MSHVRRNHGKVSDQVTVVYNPAVLTVLLYIDITTWAGQTCLEACHWWTVSMGRPATRHSLARTHDQRVKYGPFIV